MLFFSFLLKAIIIVSSLFADSHAGVDSVLLVIAFGTSVDALFSASAMQIPEMCRAMKC